MEIKIEFEIGVSPALMALLTAIAAGSTAPVADIKADKKPGKKEEKSVAELAAAKDAEQATGWTADKLRGKARELGDGKKAEVIALLKNTFHVKGIGDVPPERMQEFADALDNLQEL